MLQIKEAGVWFCKNQKKKCLATLYDTSTTFFDLISPLKHGITGKVVGASFFFLLHMDSCHQTAASWTDKNKSNLS